MKLKTLLNKYKYNPKLPESYSKEELEDIRNKYTDKWRIRDRNLQISLNKLDYEMEQKYGVEVEQLQGEPHKYYQFNVWWNIINLVKQLRP